MDFYRFQEKTRSIALSIFSRIYGIISIISRPFVKVDPTSILFWSWNSRQYGCNPKAISDFLISKHEGEFKIYWSFKGQFPSNLDENIYPLKWGSWKYLITALKCKFLVSNTRNDIETMLFYKRKNQIYIMTWHAGMSLKKIEKDGLESLSMHYLKRSKFDSKICDLMLSGSEFQTNIFKKSFWYEGEILNCGTPRNDIFFTDGENIRSVVCRSFNIPDSSLIVLYAPTFRSDFNADVISFNWGNIKNALETKYNKKAVLLVRLHPNIKNMVHSLNFKFNNNCIDASSYPDMQNLLIASDILITDYSSSMFDFSLTEKPCFLFVKDLIEYDRGFYIPLSKLPYDISENDDTLEKQITDFDEKKYYEKLNEFYNQIGSFENGKASESLYNWIIEKKA